VIGDFGGRIVSGASSLITGGARSAQAGIRAVRDWAEERWADWEMQRYLKFHPSVAPDPATKEREDAFYQHAHAVVELYKSIEDAEIEAAAGTTKADRRHWRGEAQASKAGAKRALPLLITAFESEIKDQSVADVIASASTLIESLAAHLKYAVPRALHPHDALQDLHCAMLTQANPWLDNQTHCD